MSPSNADSDTIALIRRLAAAPDGVWTSKQAGSDMRAHNLRVDGVCEDIVKWIDAGERVKPTVLHAFKDRVGQAAWEMKPEINGVRFYLKVTVDDRDAPGESLGILSCHPDH
ncbi:MAG: hypothetical protein B6D36_08645 [Planctomycetes bacterium UTPLA1]|jgi:hypothetical protein|nr:MAG: hypothetical protein B6D36_08645 [Planctomycetes bacterium UTPLA1]